MYAGIGCNVVSFQEITPEVMEKVAQLSPHRSFPVFPRFFEGVRERYSHYLLFYQNQSTNIIGYLPLLLQEIEIQENKSINTLFQGEAILPIEYLKNGLDQYGLFKFCWTIWKKDPFRKLICWSKMDSFNSYKLLLRNINCVYPSRRKTISLFMMQTILIIGKNFFSRAFNPINGTVNDLVLKQKETSWDIEANWQEEPTKEVTITDQDILYFLKLTSQNSIKSSLIVVYPFSIFNFLRLSFKQYYFTIRN